MEIRWLHFIIVNLVYILPHLLAKPVSLNDILAAESKQFNITTVARQKISEITARRLAHDKNEYYNEKAPKTTGNKFSDSVAAKLSSDKSLNTDSIKSRLNKLSENINGRFPLLKSVTRDFRTIFSKDPESDTGRQDDTKNSRKTKVKSAKDSIPGKSLFGKTFDRLKPKKFKTIGDILSRNNPKSSTKFKLSPTLLKPKTFHEESLRFKRRNQSIKRENDSYEEFRKYVPLLRNFGLLVDNLLSSVSGEYIDRHGKPKEGVVCSCSRKSDTKSAESKIQETIAATTIAPEIPSEPTTEAPSKTTYPTTLSNISTVRQNQNVPLLLPRNTTRVGRNNHGIRQRNRASLHGDAEGNISGDNGDSEYDSGSKESHYDAADDEEDTDSNSRDRTSNDKRDRLSGANEANDKRTRLLGRELAPVFRRTYHKDKTEITKDFETSRRDIVEGENHIEVGRHEANSARDIPKYIPKHREVSRVQVDSDAESVRSEEDDEKSVNNVGIDLSDDQRISDGDITFASKDQTISEANEAVITIKDLTNPILLLQSTPRGKAPVVSIIDGYSVADKNSANNHRYSNEKDSY